MVFHVADKGSVIRMKILRFPQFARLPSTTALMLRRLRFACYRPTNVSK